MTCSLVKGDYGPTAWDRGVFYVNKDILETLVLGQGSASEPQKWLVAIQKFFLVITPGTD